MGKEKEYEDFFSSEFGSTYIKYSDSMVRYAVSGISAACNIIDDIQRNGGKAEETAEMTKAIMSMCRKLMRMARLGYVLCEAANFEAIDLDTIDIDSFAEDFVHSCNIILGGKCEIVLSGRLNSSFVGSRELISFFMLSHIRRILKSFKSCNRIVISLEAIKKLFKITIKADGVSAQTRKNSDTFNDASEAFASETDAIFEHNLKLHCEYKEGEMSFFLPRLTCAGEIKFESPEIENGTERFSDSVIMLSDIDMMHESD